MSAGTRIKYKRGADGHLYTNEFLAGAALVKGKILTGEQRSAYLLMVINGEYKPVTAISYNDLPQAKKFIKSFMKERGVKFDNEVRKKVR